MKTRRSGAVALGILALIGCSLPTCNPPADSTTVGGSSSGAHPPRGTAVVFGTVIDLKSGDPIADVEVSLSGVRATRTDAQGRFEISGLAAGTRGDVRARSADGREGAVPLLTLGNERREIVVHLGAN